MQLLAPTNLVARGRSSSLLPQAKIDLSRFTYNYQNRERSLDDFVTETRVAGLLVIKDGRIVAERYEQGHTPDSVWTSFSVAKSISSPSELEVELYFTNPKLPKWANTCGAGEFVTRKVKRTKRIADAALKLLFFFFSEEEKAKGMESLSPLNKYYLGISIKDGTAVVNFRLGAEKYLYVAGPACQQERVLTPIVKTLKRFSTIRSVDFAINGKIIEEWDA